MEPLSPVIDNYKNPLNSENIRGGFMTSTPMPTMTSKRPCSPSILNYRRSRYNIKQVRIGKLVCPI